MKKRIQKKKSKMKMKIEELAEKREFYIQGNNGGDIFSIQKVTDDTSHIFVGSSCVVILDKIVPNEFLPMVIFEVLIERNQSIEDFIKNTNHSEEYKKELISKIKKPY